MKIVLNKCYGGFSISDWAVQELGRKDVWDIDRFDDDLVRLVEQDATKASGSYSKLVVVNMPDSATDYTIDEYDGSETLIYVVDGKLHFA